MPSQGVEAFMVYQRGLGAMDSCIIHPYTTTYIRPSQNVTAMTGASSTAQPIEAAECLHLSTNTRETNFLKTSPRL
ncbi:hypothetical protein PAXRUDRAFT_736297 [Paxillus rubicundulus Ve08.2h10]|uniref:Unplaced genomic scaffold scaffold_88, whole genome shotgun sequence n=1 Tax=Paxillus rubicundulus Ve08.2h10 TaxID=930991 RepID=A0A0D0E266_9AGAM|nr:hypothetical protein PAXRUDRAFT_736297 [Paxillus rubicundulus Ve08.2h10]